MRSTVILFLFLSSLSLQSFALDKFQTGTDAQQHCPNDWVAWLKENNVLVQGGQEFGKSPNGAYVCLEEAQNEGYRGKRNGQPFRFPQKKHPAQPVPPQPVPATQ
jgi:hypothetical protein